MEFRLCENTGFWLRLALTGPSGSGKTYTALKVATEMGFERIGIIDTENRSARRYARSFGQRFSCLELDHFSPRDYIEALHIAVDCGLQVLIIDSLSHAWMTDVSKPGDPLDPLCRSAVLDLLTLPGWASRSSRALAKVFKISHTTAAKLRALVPAATPPDRIGLDDRLIDTTNIGGRSTRGEELAAAAEHVAGVVERQMEGLRAELLREVRSQIPAAPDKLYTAKQMCDYLQVPLRRWREIYLCGRLDAAQVSLGDGEDELRWDPAGVLRLLRVKP